MRVERSSAPRSFSGRAPGRTFPFKTTDSFLSLEPSMGPRIRSSCAENAAGAKENRAPANASREAIFKRVPITNHFLPELLTDPLSTEWRFPFRLHRE